MAEKAGAPPDIVERPGNKECADCKAYGPNWASWNLGILICETCSGVHRNLGTHISKVKSTKLDKWKPEQVIPCRKIGNEVSNAFYEYDVPPGTKYVASVKSSGGDKIDPTEARKLERWIRAKYEAKKYARPGVDPPHVRLERGESLTDAQVEGTSPSKKEGKEKKEKKSKEPKEPKEPKEEPDASKGFREAKVQVTEPLRPQSQRAWGCSPRFRSFEAYHSPCAEASRDKVLKSVPAWSFARNDVGLREGAQRPRPERATDFRRLRDAVALDEAWLEVRR